MDKTAPCEQSRHCTSSAPRAPAAPRFAPDADQLARLLTPALLDRVRDAIIVLGIDHRIWVWNKNAELMYGMERRNHAATQGWQHGGGAGALDMPGR